MISSTWGNGMNEKRRIYRLFAFFITIACLCFRSRCYAWVQIDSYAFGGLETIKFTEKVQNVELPNLNGGSYGLGLIVEFFKKQQWALAGEVNYFQFNSNAKLQQDQFGTLQSGEFTASASTISLGPAVIYSLTEKLRMKAGISYDYGFAGTIKFNLGVLTFNPTVDSFSRYGVTFSADYTFWKSLFAGTLIAAKLGSISTKAAPTDIVRIEGKQPLRSASVQVFVGWAFPVSTSSNSGLDASRVGGPEGTSTKDGKGSIAPNDNKKKLSKPSPH